ncbi:MAG: nucleoside-diphosphate kinase [Candidatus Diapherotrites archaeon]|nr:nucleoside-diphosphate kinase [Candidatus Diapherotrites archaeon]
MPKERTLVIIKPDAVNRALIGEIIKRFEVKGLKVVGMKMKKLNIEELYKHYEHHKDKPFFNELVSFMASIPSVLLVLEGKEAVAVVRRMVGPTLGREAMPGTIRGDFSMSIQCNVVHASENVEIAKKEINRFFKKEELYDYNRIDFEWVYAERERKIASGK